MKAPVREDGLSNLFALTDKLAAQYLKLVNEGKGTSTEGMRLYRLREALYNSMNSSLQVISVSGTSWLDWLIRLFSGFSRSSHTAYIRGEVKIEAWAGENKVRIVVGVKTGYENAKSYVYDCAPVITLQDQDEIWNWAIGQEGCYYDWLAALGILFKKNWDNTKAYICSELTYQGFLNIGFVDTNSGIKDASKVKPSVQEKASYLIFNRKV